MTHRKALSGVVVSLCLASTTVNAAALVIISEVLLDPLGVNTGRQLVELTNVGDTDFSMGGTGYWLYFPPSSWQFPPNVVLPAGSSLQVYINRPGSATPTELYTGSSGMRTLRGQGSQGDSIALFRSNLFADPTALVDFVQWGAAGNGVEDIAALAGQWTQGTFVDLSSLRDGASLAHDGTGDSAQDWCIDGTPTPGAPNDTCTLPLARSPVVINEIGYERTGPNQYHAVVELKNVGTVLEDIGGRWLVLSNQHSYQLPTGSPDTLMFPGEICRVHLGVSGEHGQLDFYTGNGSFRPLQANDSFSLHYLQPFTDATGIIDFVAWGAPASPLEGAAVQAGLWTAGTSVSSADLRPRGSVARQTTGTGAEAWAVDNTGTIGAENDAPPFVPVVINEALIDPPGAAAGAGLVELRNVLVGEAFPLTHCSLCLESSAAPGTLRCYRFKAGAVVPAGGYLVVQLNAAGLDTAARVFTGPGFQELDRVSDSLFLFASQEVTSDPNNLLDYFRWGPDSTFGESLAVAAGIWPESAAIDVAEVRENSSLAYGGSGDTPQSYRIDPHPSLGQPNDETNREEPFRRGDCNDNGEVDISDAISLLNFLFSGVPGKLCADACDANDDESQDISDPVFLLSYLFAGGRAPGFPGPGPTCARETNAGVLTCNAYLSCN
jgi:hypothetical protein